MNLFPCIIGERAVCRRTDGLSENGRPVGARTAGLFALSVAAGGCLATTQGGRLQWQRHSLHPRALRGQRYYAPRYYDPA